ncbi:hypothetical protein OOK60_16175 [Trichothermofontia sichuanensis B231]|nr:hypothetical protein [Trichothermofontia sichuanensis]UZQ54008.1 hypothetical protein OOK60_16175 [Trichothermofontia sichuanensis B231]
MRIGFSRGHVLAIGHPAGRPIVMAVGRSPPQYSSVLQYSSVFILET